MSATAFKGKASGAAEVAASRRTIDREMLRRALSVLVDPAHLVEVCRCPPRVSRVRPGSDLDGLVSAVAGLGLANSFLTLNPVRADRGKDATAAAADVDIARYRWLFIDVDAIRRNSTDCCATDAEKAKAFLAAEGLREHLLSLGWPEPVEVDSGNGFYLLFRIDLPADEAHQALIRGVLHALADEFPGSNLDLSVHNPGRLARLPGTWNRKGKDEPDRPHRLARLVKVPEGTIGLVNREQLEALAGPAQEPSCASRNGKAPSGSAFRGKAATALQKYARRALKDAAYQVVMAHVGKRNDELNTAAFSMGQLVAIEAIGEKEVTQELAEAAQRALLDEAEILPTIRSGLKGGKQRPRIRFPDWLVEEMRKEQDKATGDATASPPDRPLWSFLLDGELLAEGEPGEILPESEGGTPDRRVRTFDMMTLGALTAREFVEPRWIVPGIMSEGLNILAGAPKQGKSILALNLALTVAGAGKALGNIQLEAADVLYLSLEDKQRRVKSRALKMLDVIRPDLTQEAANRLVVVTDWPRQDEGGLQALDIWMRKAASPGLIIIDVWNRFCPKQKPTGNAYNQDADWMAEVKRFADERGLSILIIHHTRKSPVAKEPEDYVQEISGTLGLSGAADGLLVLLRTRKDAQANLCITGRDVPDKELILEFNKVALTWKSLGTADQHVEGKVQQKVVAYLRRLNGMAAFVKDIADGIEEKYDSVRKACQSLFVQRIVRRVGNGFAYPGEAEDIRDDEGDVPGPSD